MDNSVKRGDIFYADLSPVVGSEQGGTRPVLIVQNDTGNRHSPTVIAAAITSQTVLGNTIMQNLLCLKYYAAAAVSFPAFRRRTAAARNVPCPTMFTPSAIQFIAAAEKSREER